MSNPHQNLRERVHAKLAEAQSGESVEFDQREAKFAGYFEEDALTLEDVEASNEEDQQEA